MIDDFETEPDPDRYPDPRTKATECIEMMGLAPAIWSIGNAPEMLGEPLADGVFGPCERPDEPFLFRSWVTHRPFGFGVQIGRKGEPALRTLWLDGEELLNALVQAGIAHITGDNLKWVGPGEDPRPQAVTVPDTVPDDLDK